MIKAVLFDLDGTLLPMDQNEFVKCYFGLLCEKLIPYGYEPKKVVEAIWTSTRAMVKNDGSKLNEEVFWKHFSEILGKEILDIKYIFDEFYIEEFKKTKEKCGYTPRAKKVINLVKNSGLRAICATNPIFPKQATMHRMNFAGLDVADFEYFTYYENSKYCKPNPDYFKQVLDEIGLQAEECIMIGNDATEDVAAMNIGIKVFLLTDCLINEKTVDISGIPQGNFDDLEEFIISNINCN